MQCINVSHLGLDFIVPGPFLNIGGGGASIFCDPIGWGRSGFRASQEEGVIANPLEPASGAASHTKLLTVLAQHPQRRKEINL